MLMEGVLRPAGLLKCDWMILPSEAQLSTVRPAFRNGDSSYYVPIKYLWSAGDKETIAVVQDDELEDYFMTDGMGDLPDFDDGGGYFFSSIPFLEGIKDILGDHSKSAVELDGWDPWRDKSIVRTCDWDTVMKINLMFWDELEDTLVSAMHADDPDDVRKINKFMHTSNISSYDYADEDRLAHADEEDPWSVVDAASCDWLGDGDRYGWCRRAESNDEDKRKVFDERVKKWMADHKVKYTEPSSLDGMFYL